MSATLRGSKFITAELRGPQDIKDAFDGKPEPRRYYRIRMEDGVAPESVHVPSARYDFEEGMVIGSDVYLWIETTPVLRRVWGDGAWHEVLVGWRAVYAYAGSIPFPPHDLG